MYEDREFKDGEALVYSGSQIFIIYVMYVRII